MLPGLALVLGGLAAMQFLLRGVRYGPRSRRRMLLLAAPAALAGVLMLLIWPVRPWVLRLTIALPAAGLVYLVVAVTLVLRWRDRQLVRLVGDVRGLRRRLATLRQEIDRLFWIAGGQGSERPVPPPSTDRPSPHEWAAVVRQWQRAVPAEVSRRAAQLAEWRAEFARTGVAELRARARVLDAAWRDIPEGEQRQAVRARTAVLWLVHDELEEAGRQMPMAPSAAQERWEEMREEARQMEEDLSARLRERAELLRHQLPLD